MLTYRLWGWRTRAPASYALFGGPYAGLAGLSDTEANLCDMPDLAGILLRRSVGSLASGQSRCSACHRTPLVGEQLHEMDTGRLLCDLCVSELPEDDRRAVRSERVHASERQLPVAPRAA